MLMLGIYCMYDCKTEDQAQGKERLTSCISEGGPAIVKGTVVVLLALFVARSSSHKPLQCIVVGAVDGATFKTLSLSGVHLIGSP